MIDLNAGKYAPYVWSAYGFTVLILGGLVADSASRARHWRREVERREAEEKPK